VKKMLLKEPNPKTKHYIISLTDEEREKIRKNKKNLSPIRKKFDDIARRAKIRKMQERAGTPWNIDNNRPIRKKFY
jgi:hypothetical protein